MSAPLSETATCTVPGSSACGVRQTIWCLSNVSATTDDRLPKRQSVSLRSLEKTSNGPPVIVTLVPPRVGPPVGSIPL